MGSLAKFSNRGTHNGKRIAWNRVETDGLPFRGDAFPSYTTEEYEEKVVKVAEPQADTFNLSAPVEKKAYLEVLDGIVNGWFQCTFIRRWETPDNVKGFARIEWVEFFMEDGSPARFLTNQQMEMFNGQAHLLANPGGGPNVNG